jgi:hypothetical protein
MIKSRRAGHVASMGRRGLHKGFRRESQKERDRQEDRVVDGRIMLKWILKKEIVVAWTGFIWLRIGPRGGLL